MTKRPNRQNFAGNYSPPHQVRKSRGYPQPFWLPASNFYVLAAAIAVAVFFIVWGILHDGVGDMPWVPAGVLGSLILAGAVFLREIVLRKRRNQLLLAQERLDYNLKKVHQQRPVLQDENKLTLEKNATILKQITQKSEAANVLGKFSEAHWEVFELCEEYLHRSEKELQHIGVGSPRLAPLKQGREKVQKLHKLHLFAWSSGESRELIQEAKASATISKKLEIAAKALNILDSALRFYPDDRQLIDSANAIKEFIATVKISHWVEKAERFAFKGNYKRAINYYQDALFYLARENVRNSQGDFIAEKINLEIERLKKISAEKNQVSLHPDNEKILDDE